MNDIAAISAYGVVTEPATIRIERLLPGSIDRVWAYLTQSELRRRWLASGDMEMKAGSSFELVWRNDELTDPPGSRPEGFPEEHRMQSRITELDPPRKMTFTWGERGEVSFELEAMGGEVLLTVTHRRISDRANMLMIGAGWHMHLDVLAARLTGTKTEPFWDGWERLKKEYEPLISA
ncbi:SRPBCC family protein [Neorhizobium huautlense]|uniref:SRPBCC family protein n=1 Tax=Neorhizobium huautlense TaxID=67774 RepID=UPI000CF9057A|nr:SRPBCC family protein [Neorhizobium huautlense]